MSIVLPPIKLNLRFVAGAWAFQVRNDLVNHTNALIELKGKRPLHPASNDSREFISNRIRNRVRTYI